MLINAEQHIAEEKGFTQAELAPFIVTRNWYRHSIAKAVHYTDGRLSVAERAGADWLLDKIAFAQKGEPVFAGEEFQVWALIVVGSAAALSSRMAMGGGCWRGGSTTPTSLSQASNLMRQRCDHAAGGVLRFVVVVSERTDAVKDCCTSILIVE